MSQRVRFAARDGVRLDGRVFGTGSVAVVLSHMGDPIDNQTQWFPMAEALAERGYRVLTYNTRGICPSGAAGCSAGDYDLSQNWLDIAGAFGFLKRDGVREVVLMGASVGSMGSLVAAGRAGVDAAAVVAISGVLYCCGYDMQRATLEAVTEPKLFLAGEHDVRAAEAARTFFSWSTQPRRLEVVDAAEHGSFLFAADPPAGSRAVDATFEFLERWAPADSQ